MASMAGTGTGAGAGTGDGEGEGNGGQMANRSGVANDATPTTANNTTFKRRAQLKADAASSSASANAHVGSNGSRSLSVSAAAAAPAGFSSSIFTANPTASASSSVTIGKQSTKKTDFSKGTTPLPNSKDTSASKSKTTAAFNMNQSSSSFTFSDSSFPGLGIHPVLASHLEKLKVFTPTPIQKAAIPQLNSITDRDFIVQAQTGSGKTFAFLLPILHKLVTAAIDWESTSENHSADDFFSRNTGAFAIILTPTRELAQQIAMVLESLLKYTRTTSSSETTESAENSKCKHWIVSGLISGGESKKSEKARLRKGINILVATPGRLLDHLKTTESFSVGNLRWLILDEADNLLHLGFEETLREILFILNEKGSNSVQEGTRKSIANWPFERQTILCSATIEGGVEKLAQQELRDPLFVKSGDSFNLGEKSDAAVGGDAKAGKDDTNNTSSKDVITIPHQLKQLYILSPAKLRLVNLIGLLRKATESGKKPCKIIVFLATGDSVDWHFDCLVRGGTEEKEEEQVLKLTSVDHGQAALGKSASTPSDDAESLEPLAYNDLPKLRAGHGAKFLTNCKLFKLHGSMQQSERHAVYTGFSPSLTTTTSSILFCTDVAARGLDLPDVTHVVQYDPPADVRDYVHRIGRTARLGKDGKAFIFLLPSEVEYLELLEEYKCVVREQPSIELLQALVPLGNVKKTANAKKVKHVAHEVAATDVHMTLERFVQASKRNLMHAQKAFSSFVRAYTTHLSSEKHIFHLKKLHLGHLAKSFCLQEAPAILQSKMGKLAKSFKDKTDKVNGSGGGVTAATMKRKALMMAKGAMISEFSAGLSTTAIPVANTSKRVKTSK